MSALPLPMPYRSHPILKALRFFRPRRELPSRQQQIIEAIGRERNLPANPGQWPRIPRDSDLCKELGIELPTLRSQIALIAANIEGLEELGARERIWLAYRHDLWLEQQATVASPKPTTSL